ncbi:PTS sugar transporter subunit IIA [Lachnospiraceae bacterium ZAX-1]
MGDDKLITTLIQEDTFLKDVVCGSWEELVDIAGNLLVQKGLVEMEYLQSIKDAVEKFGAYMVLVEDVAFFHGRPEAGVHKMGMSLALLKTPVYLLDKRVKAAFVFAAVDNNSHLELLQELAFVLENEEFLTLLRDGGDQNAIMGKFKEAEGKHEIS